MKSDKNFNSPQEYIDSLEGERKAEIEKIDKLIRKTVPQLKPYMQSGMLSYGTYKYKYASGKEGEWMVIGLSSRKNYISLYAPQ